MNPSSVLHEVGTSLASILPSLENPNPVEVDQTIGHAVYLLETLQGSEANTLLTADLIGRLRYLHRLSVPALVLPLYREQKSKWVEDLDDVSNTAYNRSQALKKAMDQEERDRTQRRHKKVRLQKESGDWRNQLATAGQIIQEGLVPEEDAGDTLSDLERAKRALDATQWWDTEWNKVRGTARFEKLSVLPANVAYGVIRWPITIIGGKISSSLKRELVARGMMPTTVFLQYTMLQNCRLLGIQSEILPGASMHADRVAADVLQRAQREDRALREYTMARTHCKAKGAHTYFVLLPAGLNFNFRDWDLASPVSNDTRMPV